MIRAALVQLTSSDDPGASLPATLAAIERAADEGADWILTPEVTNCVSSRRARQEAVLRPEARGPDAGGGARGGGAAGGAGPDRLAGAARRGSGRALRQPRLRHRGGWRDRGALRQDPHVRCRPLGRRALPRIGGLPARGPGGLGGGRGPAGGHDDLLRRTVPGALPGAGAGGGAGADGAQRVLPGDGGGALGGAAAGAGDRDGVLRARAGAVRARTRPPRGRRGARTGARSRWGRGARCCSTWARRRASGWWRSTPRRWRGRGAGCRRWITTGRSTGRARTGGGTSSRSSPTGRGPTSSSPSAGSRRRSPGGPPAPAPRRAVARRARPG